MLPFDKHICGHRIHCPACRDLEGGREWRRRVAVAFAVPQPAPDWPCPAGYPWGHGGATPSTPRTTLAGLISAHSAKARGCAGCRQKRAAAHAAPETQGASPCP